MSEERLNVCTHLTFSYLNQLHSHEHEAYQQHPDRPPNITAVNGSDSRVGVDLQLPSQSPALSSSPTSPTASANIGQTSAVNILSHPPNITADLLFIKY